MPGEPILVVDDTPVNLKLTRMLLQHEGYEVRTAASAEEALDLLESFHPRLVLADIQLPGMDGLEMTRRIKGDPRNAGMLVVALTAYAMKGDEDKAMEAGCDGYITKPIDTRALGVKLRHYMDRDGAGAPAPDVRQLLPEEELRELRQRFLDDGIAQVRQWSAALDGAFQPAAASSGAHQWVGAAGLLGCPRIGELAREAEHLLLEKPLDMGQVRELLESLEAEFRNPTPQERMDESAAEARESVGCVVIAGGDPNSLALTKAIVQSQSIECQIATDGRCALEAIRRSHPGAVALDVDLPGLSAYEVLRMLRAENPGVKVLLLSSSAPPPVQADAYLTKPYNPIDLVVRLKRML